MPTISRIVTRWTLQRRRMMCVWNVFYCILGRKIWSLLTSDWRPARSWRNDMLPVRNQSSSGKGSSKAYLWTSSIMSLWYFGARSVTRASGQHKCSTGCAISRSGNFLRSVTATRHTSLTKQAWCTSFCNNWSPHLGLVGRILQSSTPAAHLALLRRHLTETIEQRRSYT